MFQTLLSLRLLILESCNELDTDEQMVTARAWADILDLESSRLIEGAAEWSVIVADVMDCDAGKLVSAEQRARKLGLADGRLSLILADQIVAALIRGHLTWVQS